MMIAKSWMKITANVEGRQQSRPRFSPRTNANLLELVQRVMPSKRDREVPYGMKGR
jgi:hypothetical protein